MADRPLFTNEAALAGANVIGVSIANPDALPTPIVGKIRLFNGTLVPDNGTTRADLVAAETTLTGYPAGGYSLTEFAAAVFAPLGGAVITSNLINVAYASGPSVQIGGYWVEDATAPTPLVREVFVYDPARTLGVVGDGFPIVVQLGYGTNFGV
jgi:hypothetical protein